MMNIERAKGVGRGRLYSGRLACQKHFVTKF
jgi:hypothetical protein